MIPQNKVKKIAFVSDAIWPYNKGGKEKRLYEVTTRLAAKGYDVTIYCMNWWKGETECIENGVKLHAISSYYPLYSGKRRSIREGILFGLACFKLLRANFDVVEVDHMPYFPLFSMRVVCWVKGKKLIAVWHEVWGREYWQEYLGEVKGSIAFILEVLSSKMPDHIISISKLTEDKLKSVLHYNRLIDRVPLGIEYSKIKEVSSSTDLSDIIYVGRLLKHKNVDFLINSICELKKSFPNICCFIVGNGPEKLNLIDLSKYLELTENVRFFDNVVEHSRVFSLMKASKVFITLSDREGFGITVLEANACGLPVIMLNHPNNAGNQLIINNSNGLIIQHNTKEIIEGVRKFLDITVEERKNIIENTRMYDWENVFDNLFLVYANYL